MKISINFSDQIDLPIRSPLDDEPLAHDDGKVVSVTIKSSQSKEYQTAKNAILNKRLRKKGKKDIMSAEEIDTGTSIMLAAVTVSYNNFEGVDFGVGEMIVKDCVDHYDEPKLRWFRDQIEEGVAANELFMQKASTKRGKE